MGVNPRDSLGGGGGRGRYLRSVIESFDSQRSMLLLYVMLCIDVYTGIPLPQMWTLVGMYRCLHRDSPTTDVDFSGYVSMFTQGYPYHRCGL